MRMSAALRAVTAAAAEPAAVTPAGTAQSVLHALLPQIGADGGALVLMDPQTWLFTTGAVDRLPAASCHPFFRFEVDMPSPRAFRRLAATGAGAVALSRHGVDDGYAPAVLHPHGFADELRVVCRDAGAAWGGLSLWRRPAAGPFTGTDERLLDAVAGTIGSLLRSAVVRSIGTVPDHGTRHVVVLEDGVVVESSERSAVDLCELADPEAQTFRHLDHLRELARQNSTFSCVLGVVDGRWLTAHGTPLSPGRVAIVLASATPADLFGVVVAAAGLTPREVEVTRLVCRGYSDAEIAVELVLSGHTVHDHVRAIRSKLGVRSRAEVAAKVFAERYLDGFLASAAVSHRG